MPETKALREFGADEVARHNNETSAWIIMDSKVYDVTKFLMEHPGGEEVLLEQAGRDATEAFAEVGHSGDAKLMTEDYVIGKLSDSTTNKGVSSEALSRSDKDGACWADIILSPTWSNFLIPLGISVCVYLSYRTFNHVWGRVNSG